MSARAPYEGVRVLEVSSGISAAYCGKLFVDAGADVVKVEPESGDPLRLWSAAGDVLPDGDTGALFGYLHAGKRSVTTGSDVGALVADLDLVVTDGSYGWGVAAVRAAVPAGSPVVVVAVSPFGFAGPYVEEDVASNEFVLQAMSGSIGARGWRDEEPLQAGGRIGEWVAGGYAAVAASAALRHARRSGRGETIDVSVLESMVVTMGGLSAVGASALGDAFVGGSRNQELPSIVETADGLVGFCTITAQQFADFLVLIDRPDLLDDADIATMGGRVRRRHEFLEIVETWARTRTTAEIVEFAVALRIPVAPIGTPSTITEIDHFRERGVFVKNAQGALQPRPPYRSAAIAAVPSADVPTTGAASGSVGWAPRERPAPDTTADPDALPLAGVRIVDFTAFWAGPAATQILAALGADVIKIEGLRRPDGMRYSGGLPPTRDRWWESGPMFLASNTSKRDVTLELSTAKARELALRLVAESDVVIENFSPRVMGNLGLEWDAVRAANPRVVFVRMPAFGLDGPWRDRVGFAQTMEQASGLAWMTGRRDGPPLIPRGVCDPNAGLHAAFATLAALELRDATGIGLQVESTMVEAALNIGAEALLEWSVSGREPRRDGNRGPGAAPQGLYPCQGHDEWLALAVLDDERWVRFATAIGRGDLAGRADLADEAGRRRAADEIDDAVRAWSAGLEIGAAVRDARAAGVAAARVNRARDLLVDPQLIARGFLEPVVHPVLGEYLSMGLPFRFASVPGAWTREPPPTLGEHNREVLSGILGLDDAELDVLVEAAVIGTRPAGL